MSYNTATRVDCEECRITLAASIGVDYVPIGGFADLSDPDNPLYNGLIIHPVRALQLVNLTNATLWFSNDGMRNKFPLPEQGAFFFDVTSNSNSNTNSEGVYLQAKNYWWVKRFDSAPTTGGVYLTMWFGDDGNE